MSTEGRQGTRLTPQEREAAERRLQEAVGEGLLELEEFEERIDIVLRSLTREELQPAFTGLPGQPVRRLPARKVVAAVLGEDKVEGQWRPAGETITVAVLGETTLDFREAEFDRDETAVTAVAWLGGVNIVVPPEVEVAMSGFAILGERLNKTVTPVDREGPMLQVRAFAVMGEVKVWTKKRDRPVSRPPTTRRPLSRFLQRADRRVDHHRHRGIARWVAAGAIALVMLGAGWLIGSYDATAVFSGATYRVPATAEQVDALSLAGSIDVIVPPDVLVEPQGITLFGLQRCPACDRPAPEGGKVLVVRSFTLFGRLVVR
ncbi:MAG: DUF1707 domain-containing protein [Egibacteraceae bacterium]